MASNLINEIQWSPNLCVREFLRHRHRPVSASTAYALTCICFNLPARGRSQLHGCLEILTKVEDASLASLRRCEGFSNLLDCNVEPIHREEIHKMLLVPEYVEGTQSLSEWTGWRKQNRELTHNLPCSPSSVSTKKVKKRKVRHSQSTNGRKSYFLPAGNKYRSFVELRTRPAISRSLT